MTALYGNGMSDRAPVLFCPGRDLARVSERTVEIGTEGTVQLLNSIQIAELVTVDANIETAINFLNSVNRKADELIKPTE